VITAMAQDCGRGLRALRVDGGASANNFLMQFQADITGAPVQRPACIETTAMGAAYLAGLGVGYWENKDEIEKNWRRERTFEPVMPNEHRQELLAGWKKAVDCSRGWAK